MPTKNYYDEDKILGSGNNDDTTCPELTSNLVDIHPKHIFRIFEIF